MLQNIHNMETIALLSIQFTHLGQSPKIRRQLNGIKNEAAILV